MTTNTHLNKFEKLDCEFLEDLSGEADRLLDVEHLDLENAAYLVKVLFTLERYDESVKQLERMLSLEGDEAPILADIGICHFMKKDYETAVGYFAKSLEMNSEGETALSYLMLSYEFLGDYSGAVECGERLLKLNSKNDLAVRRLIDCHFKMENYDKCLECIKTIDYKDTYKKALILYKAKRFEECIEESAKLRTAESYCLAGKAFHKMGNSAKAVKYMYKAYEKDANAEVLLEIADIYFEIKDYGRAVTFLKEALLHDENDAEVLCKIARAYLETIKWQEAFEYAERAIEINKMIPEAYVILAEASFQLEPANSRRHIEILEEGIRENPDSAELWYELGGFSFPYDMHMFHRACKKAISMRPCELKFYERYIYLLLMSDDNETAKKYYNEMILANPLYEESFGEFKRSRFLSE